MKNKVCIFFGVLILLAMILFLRPSFSQKKNNSSDETASFAEQTRSSVVSKKQEPSKAPIANKLNALNSQAVTVSPLSQRQKLLAASETLKEETVELENGHKTSSLLKTPFKYPFLQRDVVTDENGELVSDVIFVADHALIKFPATFTVEKIQEWTLQAGFNIRKKLRTDSIYIVSTKSPGLFDTEKLIKKFEADFKIEGLEVTASVAERDYIYTTQATPNDPDYNDLWGLHNTGQTGGVTDADIDAPEAWDITTGASDVLVAVIDTGVDLTHPDLVSNIWVNPGEIAGNGIDDDGNGFIDDVHGWDFANDDSSPQDDDNHGTHTAGTIGAAGNDNNGVVGVNWDVSIMAIKFLGTLGGTSSDAIDSVNYTTLAGAQLTSNSWGGGGFSSLLEAAIQNAGDNEILFVAAAGNDATNNDFVENYPSGYNVDTIISVASTTDTDSLSSFSNFGATTVDLGAPGSAILSTVIGGYDSLSGTSMATPHVSGVLCLMKSLAPQMTALELKDLILASTDPVSSLNGVTLTGGRLNAFNAVSPLNGSLLRVATFEREMTSGNGDEYLNPGESGNFVFTLINRGSEPAINGTATLNAVTANSDVSVGSILVSVGDLNPGETTGEFRIPFVVSSSASTPQNIAYELTTNDDDGNSVTSNHALSINTTSVISGHVYNLGDGSRIDGATVIARGPITAETLTDLNGDFTFNVVDGDYDITASASGFVSSSSISETVPPSVTGLSIGLGVPILTVTPTSVHEVLDSGNTRDVTLTLSNSGTAPVTWRLLTSLSNSTNGLITLDEKKLINRNDNGTLTAQTINPITIKNLAGSHFGFISTTSSSLEADLVAAGALITRLSFPVVASDLERIGSLIIDDSVSSASATDITVIRDWVSSGRGLLLTGDTTVENNNAILEGTGITTTRFSDGSYPIEVITDITPDSLTAGVTLVDFSSYGTTSTTSSPARSLMRNNAGDTVMAVSILGRGSVVYLSNEADSSTGGDGRLLLNNIAESLAQTSSWLSFSENSGEIPAGGDAQITLTLDATDLVAGTYTAEAIVESNELQNSTHIVPVTLIVNGSPAITTDYTTHDFGDVVLGASNQTQLTIINNGTDTLEIASANFSNAQFTIAESFPLNVLPQEEAIVNITLTASNLGAITGTLTLENNTISNPTYEVSFTANGVDAPMITVDANIYDFTLSPNQSIAEILTITNGGGGNLNWTINIVPSGGSGSSDSLQSTLDDLNENFADITALIPNRYNFTNGVIGNNISDGGNDMYDGGNSLSTNLDANLAYSDNTIIDSNGFGLSGRYFTRKYEGLFVMAADLEDIESFQISGNLGADGGGSTDTSILTATHLGVEYTGYVKRVYGTSDPSVNHLIIVPSDNGITRTASTNTDNDEHILTGLSSANRLYHLLFASSDGGYIDDAVMQDILEEFLSETSGAIGWLTTSSAAASLPGSSAEDITLTFSAGNLPAGHYTAEIQISSDDPGVPLTTIPANIEVLSSPSITTDRTSHNFGDVFSGGAPSTVLTITNDGNDTLEITSASFSNSDFSILEGFPLTLEAGDEASVTIVINPSTLGSINGTLTLNNNSTSSAAYEIALSGNGVAAPVIEISDSSYAKAVLLNNSDIDSLSIENNGGSPLNWTMNIVPTGGSGSSDSLQNTLDDLNENFADITALIPNRYNFTDGVIGNNISDGGNDMYDWGNYLSTNLGTNLAYSDNTIIDSNGFGLSGRYFTRKYEGLFVMAADLEDIESFQISGDLGADGGGSTDTSILTATHLGVEYTGYVKRVYAAFDPSVNHLIIVPSDNGITRTASTNTNNDEHILTGLSSTDRLYHLLFASSSGGYIDDTVMQSIMEEFLSKTTGPVDWLTSTSYTGSILGGSSEDLDLTFNAANLPVGNYSADIQILSNDPARALTIIPVNMTVTAYQPELYETWRDSYLGGNVPDSEFGADWNNDGITNGQEFYFGINPNNPSLDLNHLPSITSTAGGMALSYTRNSDLSDTILRWLKSPDLEDWTPLGNTNLNLTDNNDGTTNVELILEDLSQEEQFYRAELLSNP